MPEIIKPHERTAATRMRLAKRCIMCGGTKPASEFYQVRYITNQGKQSVRLEPRCKPCARARRMVQYYRDPEKVSKQRRRWNEANHDYLVAYRKMRQADPAHRANKAKNQRLRKARCRSGQGDNAAIRAIYAQAIREEALIQPCPLFNLPELGKKLHVDHVMPLAKGGLHHEENLQILAAGLNMRKGAQCPR